MEEGGPGETVESGDSRNSYSFLCHHSPLNNASAARAERALLREKRRPSRVFTVPSEGMHLCRVHLCTYNRARDRTRERVLDYLGNA